MEPKANAVQSIPSAWQELICKLEGVYSSHVVFSADGAAEEIHVLASTERNAKSLTRDIQSAIASAFGAAIDYRIISVAQIHPQMTTALRARLKFVGIETRSIGDSVELAVLLARGEHTYRGSTTCSNRQFSRMRGVAAATLDAIAQYISTPNYFEIVDTSVVDFSGQAVVLVSVWCSGDHKKLLGCAVAGSDMDTAMVHATLGAINRKVDMLPFEDER